MTAIEKIRLILGERVKDYCREGDWHNFLLGLGIVVIGEEMRSDYSLDRFVIIDDPKTNPKTNRFLVIEKEFACKIVVRGLPPYLK